jgi:hypothetical protein
MSPDFKKGIWKPTKEFLKASELIPFGISESIMRTQHYGDSSNEEEAAKYIFKKTHEELMEILTESHLNYILIKVDSNVTMELPNRWRIELKYQLLIKVR